MDNNLSFREPLHKSVKPLTDDKAWDAVLEAHKREDFKGVVTGIIDYVDPTLAAKTGNAERTVFKIPHGSAQLNIDITGDYLKIYAPFLNIAKAKKIPLTRKVTELNFSPLNLSQIQLKGDELFFHYQCPIELCEPYKTYEALKEICVYADAYDDEFIRKFGAEWIVAPVIVHYSEADKQRAWETMQQYIEEAKAAVSYFENKRVFNAAWDIQIITLVKLEYFLQPQGYLRSEIEKMVGYMTNGQDSINDKVNRGKAYLNKLATYPIEEFNADLYTTETFIPYKVRSNEVAVRNSSENAFAQSKAQIEQGDHIGATLTLTYHFLNLFYNSNVPEEIANTLDKALQNSSAKPWPEASTILFAAITGIMASVNHHTGEKVKGFFRKIFGK